MIQIKEYYILLDQKKKTIHLCNKFYGYKWKMRDMFQAMDYAIRLNRGESIFNRPLNVKEIAKRLKMSHKTVSSIINKFLTGLKNEYI
jgi:Mor family transcriptional regulator